MNIKEFVQKHFSATVVVLLLMTLGWNMTWDVVKAANPDAAQITRDVIETLVGDVIDAKVRPLEESMKRIEAQLSIKNDFPVMVLELEMNMFSTADEVNDRIDVWESQVWGVQLAAMKYISNNQMARDELKQRIIYPEVYMAFMKRVMRY